jgi:Phage protein Gp138 N-terminal domain
MSDPTQQPITFESLMREAMDARCEQINTCIPARVVAYYPATQTADLLPSVKRPMRTDDDSAPVTVEPIPKLAGVPVVFPRSGGAVFHVPPQAGDFLLLVFCQWSISQFRSANLDNTPRDDEAVSPGDMGHHSMRNALAIAGIFPSGMALAGLSATDILLGTPNGLGLKITSSKCQVGDASQPMKSAARKGDAVQVTIDPTDIAAMGLSNGAGPVTALNPVTVNGTITGVCSSKVDISD